MNNNKNAERVHGGEGLKIRCSIARASRRRRREKGLCTEGLSRYPVVDVVEQQQKKQLSTQV